MKHRLLLLICLLFVGGHAQAAVVDGYRQAIQLAAQGQDRAAVAALRALATTEPQGSIWQQRLVAAATLLAMRQRGQKALPHTGGINPNLTLASAYLASHPLLNDVEQWPARLLAAVLPGAGHAWLGRWHDAGMAAMMVYPMLLLTLWAWRRRMGPVTIFFALITAWLWSGTVFSATSLAARASAESYMAWWQGLWQAAALPGRPW